MYLFRYNFFALGTNNEICIFAENKNIADNYFCIADTEIKRIEKKFSRYQIESIISRINHSAGISPLKVDEETSALLNYAQACYHESAGLFDITSGVLRRAWNFKKKKLPDNQQIEELLPLIGWDKVSWNGEEILLSKPGMEIDFGGFGKEYAVDRACEALAYNGVRHAIINLGGDVRAVGPKADSSPWKVGITHPRKTNSAITHIELTVGAIATSGDYERYFEIDNKRYCHILNPKTGFPITGFQSISVLNELCIVAGGIATIAMLKEKNNILNYLNSLGVSYFAVNENSELAKNTFKK